MSDGISDGNRARGLDDILATGAAWITEKELAEIGDELKRLRRHRHAELNRDRYFFAQDESCHWYIIPERLRAEWYEWTQLDPDNEDSWSPPKGARRLDGGPQAVTFENPSGGGA